MCSRSYMHELQKDCLHQRHISVCSPAALFERKNKEKEKLWHEGEMSVKIHCSHDVSRGTSAETLPRVIKPFLFLHFSNFTSHFLSIFSTASIMHRSHHVISHSELCQDWIQHKRSTSISLSILKYNINI